MEAAKQKVTDQGDLRDKAGLSEKVMKKYGQTICAIIETTLQKEESSYPALRRPVRLGKNDKVVLEKLNKLITLKSELLGISPGLIGNTAELKLLANTLGGKTIEVTQQLRQTDGWRKSFLEDFIRQSR